MHLESTFAKFRQNAIHIFVCSFLLSFILVTSSRAQSEVYTKWTARFDAAHAFDQPFAMAVDGKGNTFVTGQTCVANPCSTVNQESLTIAYDSKGNVKWRAFLGQDANGLDVAVDAAGNVYVLSIFYPDSYLPEVVTAKYSPSGVRQWVDFIASKPSFFNNPSTAYRPVKLAVSPEGNVYVGITKVDQIPNPTPGSGPGTTINAIAFKYDTNGKQIWTKEAPPTPNQYNSAVSIRLDAAENVYVLVFSLFNSQIHDSFIVKYDSNGNFLNTYGSSQLGTIAAFRVDARGNSYVAGGGSPQPPNGKEDRIVAKFSPAGVLDWLHDFGPEFNTITNNPPPNSGVNSSSFADLAVDSAGNVFVAQTLPGAVPSAGGFDISVVKFNSPGTIQWTSRFNGHSDDSDADQAVAVAVNSSGNAYVTGYGSVGPATIKYDPNGKQIWAEVQGGPGPVSLALSGGDVIVTGEISSATTSADWATIDYVQDAAKVSPTSLSFGNQKVGTVSASKTVILTNTAEVPLAITGISITGEFELTNNCPSTVAAGATCTFTVKFAPTQLGGLAGTVTVHDNWSGSAVHPQTVQLTGTGTT
jgi:hypothetical protein